MTTHAPSDPTSLEARVLRLEDLEEIRDVTARYGHSVSRGFAGRDLDWEAFANVFTDDAVWHSDFMKIHTEGREAIVENMHEQDKTIEASVHSFTNPVIDLAGDAATGSWVMPIGASHGGSNRSVFLCADFDYRRTAQGWRIAKADVTFAAALVVGGH